MRAYYAVHSDKTHVKVDSPKAFAARFIRSSWTLVESDSDGWIKHEGRECPLPDDVKCEVTTLSGSGIIVKAGRMDWGSVVRYRPILAEKVQEPEPQTIGDLIRRDHLYKDRKQAEKVQEPEPTKPKRLFDDLLERLEASHAAAQALPDLVEQLRDRLKPMGLSVMYLSEFDAAEPEPAIETPQDMSDWRNWREGDNVRCLTNYGWGTVFLTGHIYKVEKLKTDGPIIAGQEIGRHVSDFRFHSRPAKGEK